MDETFSGSSAGAASEGGWTLGRKVVLAVLMTIAAGLAALLINEARILRSSLYGMAEANFVRTATNLSDAIAKGVRWKKAAGVEAEYAKLLSDESSQLAALIVRHGDGEVLATFQSERLRPYDLSTLSGPTQPTEPSAMREGGHFVFVAPVVFGGEPVGSLAVAWDLGAVEATVDGTVREQILVGLAMLALVGALSILLLSRLVTRPLSRVTAAIGEVCAGNLDSPIPYAARGDEIGTLSRAIAVFRDRTRDAGALRRERDEQEARAADERNAATRKLAETFETSVGRSIASVGAAAETMRDLATKLRAAAAESIAKSSESASEAQEASQNMEAISAAAEQMNATLSDIARHIERSSAMAGEAAGNAQSANETLRRLADATDRIGEIVKLINEIAEQTNLLALNATIEAARAGDAGKGFAVVASEVKALAGQTASATDDIRSQVEQIRGVAAESVTIMKDISNMVGHISENTTSVSAAVQEQLAAVSEVTRNIGGAASRTRRVVDTSTVVVDYATRTGGTSAEVETAAGSLAQVAEGLSGEVDRFLNRVRSGGSA